MKNKGFTLIELIAVILILAIVALIAFPVMTRVIDKAKKGAAEASALNYIDAVEKYIMLHDMNPTKYPYDLKNNTFYVAYNTEISLLDIIIPKVNAEELIPALNSFINVKGEKPTSGTISINEKGKVTTANLVISNYNISCTNDTCNVVGVNNKYFVTFDAAGGQLSRINYEYEIGGNESLPVPTKEDYVFRGWYTSKNVRINTSHDLTKSETLYAHWTQSHTVTFNVNGGPNMEENEITYYMDEETSFPTPSRDNYYFMGWYTEQYAGDLISSPSNLTEDVTLYAHWAMLVDNIPSSEVASLIEKPIYYKDDSNWFILYVGSEFSSDGQRMYIMSKTTRWYGKPTASGSYNNTVMKLSSGAYLSSWGNAYPNSTINGAYKTWWMLTAANFTDYLDTNVGEWAIGGPTPDLFYKAYNIKYNASLAYNSYSQNGYPNSLANSINVFGPSAGCWVVFLAGPGSYDRGWQMVHEFMGSYNRTWSVADKDGNFGFSPVICIKKNMKIYWDGSKYIFVD